MKAVPLDVKLILFGIGFDEYLLEMKYMLNDIASAASTGDKEAEEAWSVCLDCLTELYIEAVADKHEGNVPPRFEKMHDEKIERILKSIECFGELRDTQIITLARNKKGRAIFLCMWYDHDMMESVHRFIDNEAKLESVKETIRQYEDERNLMGETYNDNRVSHIRRLVDNVLGVLEGDDE